MAFGFVASVIDLFFLFQILFIILCNKNISGLCLSLITIIISIGEDVDYNGDDDQFDTLERQRRTIALPDELPSVIHEGI